MKILDLDLDYFMDDIATNTPESSANRLTEENYGGSVWPADFLENNLGLSRSKK